MDRVLIVLPFDMSFRNFVTSPVAANLAANASLQVMIVSREAADGAVVASICDNRIAWQPLLRPFRQSLSPRIAPLRRLRLLAADIRAALGHYHFMALVHRFNTIHRFRGFRDRLKQSARLRKPAIAEGLPLSRRFGFPWPASRSIFRLLHRIYFSSWQRHKFVEDQFEAFTPNVVVLAHLQNAFVTPYAMASLARKIPILGINGSWDQPTTKGPLMPGLRRILVQSRQVADDLTTYHAVSREIMEIVGWPQMDIYAHTEAICARSTFLRDIGLAPDARYILVAAYADRLGAHEPDMCKALIEEIGKGTFGSGAVLYVRCHPLDRDWQRRLGDLHRPPYAVVEPPNLGALDHLANLIRHAEVAIASAGTINLDAAALDTPSIAVAFEDETVPYFDRPARRYDMEHIAGIMASGGIHKASSLTDLIELIRDFMADRGKDGEGRKRLRKQHLEPLDGNASQRIAHAISQFAHDVAEAREANS